MRPNSFAVIAAGLFVCIAGSAWAQTGAGDSVHGGPVNQSSSNGPSDGDNGPDVRAPVLRITSVEVIRSSHGPTLDIIRVRGLASSRGWPGKLFVAKGAAVPTGKSASEVIKEEQLPPMSRIIKHSDGIPTANCNPNRLGNAGARGA
jgi:hypothetical protein